MQILGRPFKVRFVWYACMASAAVLVALVLHHSWLPVSALFAAAVPAVERTTLRRLPRRQEGHGSRAGRDPLLEALKPLETEGYQVLSTPGGLEERIDHIVVGPTGVFTIERNDWTGRFSLRRDGWFQHTKHDAGIAVWHANQRVMAIKSRLGSLGVKVPVHGLVAVTVGKVNEGAIEMGQVLFLPASDVAQHIRSRHRRLDEGQVARITRAISQSGLTTAAD